MLFSGVVPVKDNGVIKCVGAIAHPVNLSARLMPPAKGIVQRAQLVFVFVGAVP